MLTTLYLKCKARTSIKNLQIPPFPARDDSYSAGSSYRTRWLLPNEHLFIIIPDFKSQVWQSLTWMIIFSALFTIIIIAAFYITVRTMLNQKKMSEIKSDFINNMTMNLKPSRHNFPGCGCSEK
jgi:hypothetical protein